MNTQTLKKVVSITKNKENLYAAALIDKKSGSAFSLGTYQSYTKPDIEDIVKEIYKNLIKRFQCNIFEIRIHLIKHIKDMTL